MRSATPKLDKVFKVAQYRYKGPRTPGPLFDAEHAGRLYVDETTGVILESLIEQVSNGRDKIGNNIGFAVAGSRVLEMSDALRNSGGLGNYVFTPEDMKTVHALASTLEKSYADNPHGLIVVKPLKGQTLRQVRATIAHELAHVNQYRMLEEKAQNKYPGVKREDRPIEWVMLTHDKFLEDYSKGEDTSLNDLIHDAAKELKRRGYRMIKDVFEREILSHAIGGDYLGIGVDRMAELVGEIIESAVEKHGPEAAERLLKNAKSGFNKEVQEARAKKRSQSPAAPQKPMGNGSGSGGKGGQEGGNGDVQASLRRTKPPEWGK